MSNRRFAILAAAWFAGWLALLFGVPALSQGRTACANRDLVVQQLAERYGESLQSMGLHGQGGVLEVWASDETGTWSILITSPDGKACMIAAGKMWEPDARPLGPQGKDT